MSQMSEPGRVFVAGIVIVTAAGVGLAIGLIVSALGKRNGKPSLGKQVFQVAQHAIQGLAVGSLASDYLSRVLESPDN